MAGLGSPWPPWSFGPLTLAKAIDPHDRRGSELTDWVCTAAAITKWSTRDSATSRPGSERRRALGTPGARRPAAARRGSSSEPAAAVVTSPSVPACRTRRDGPLDPPGCARSPEDRLRDSYSGVLLA